MTSPESSNQTQEVISKQLILIEEQLNELLQEKMALQRLLLKARRSDPSLKDVTRKNSVERILIEKNIIDKLSVAKRSLPASDLYKYAKEIKPDLKDSTFRSYLKRMGDRGLIQAARERGRWGLPKIAPELNIVRTGK